jgi:hypothetical protein
MRDILHITYPIGILVEVSGREPTEDECVKFDLQNKRMLEHSFTEVDSASSDKTTRAERRRAEKRNKESLGV